MDALPAVALAFAIPVRLLGAPLIPALNQDAGLLLAWIVIWAALLAAVIIVSLLSKLLR